MMVCLFHNGYFPPPAARVLRVSFLGTSLWECGNVSVGKSRESLGVCLRPWTTWISHTHATPHPAFGYVSKLPFKCSYKFIVLAICASDKQILAVTEWTYLFLQNAKWPFALRPQASWVQESGWSPVFLILFLIGRMVVITAKLFTYQYRNRKLVNTFLTSRSFPVQNYLCFSIKSCLFPCIS